MTENLTSKDAVRAHYGQPGELARRKQLAALDQHARAFIALSPFLVIASADAAGRADATPRGDAPGFVAVMDNSTLLIPDRRGNNRVDTMLNIAENPHVGLLFLVPGIDETLRVNGTAWITTDVSRLAPLAAQGKTPAAGLLVRIEEVFFHCGKALIRSQLWDVERQVERRSFPTLGRIIADQIAGADPRTCEQAIEESYRDRLY
ncbi:MAG: pyridoxamine 5'-phosphate oxidase family protein [Pseudomonadota bacterium]|nr:pyridoxamine 5'-phosphate oxidase family protein [Pseudomonadota bacterium]